MKESKLTGGCQCGAIRFAVTRLGRASMCHCRMCQKAFGSIGGLLVTARDLQWTRGTPKHYQSSNKVRRGFCSDCGTPLTYEYEGSTVIAICAFDDPAALPPTIQLPSARRVPWADALANLPSLSAREQEMAAARYASVISYQHPDHDTHAWPPPRAGERHEQ